MAGALLQSTIFSSTISSQSNIRSQQYENTKRSVKMMCSLKSSPMRVAAFSGLHGVNALNNIVNSKASRIVPKAMFEHFQETYEEFSENGKKVIMLAQEEARRLGHNFVGTEQILLGIIREDTGIAAKVLNSTGINLKDARVEVENIIGRGSGFVTEEIPFTPRANHVIDLSLEEARQLDHDNIGSEDLLLGLLREDEGVAARVLKNLGADTKKIREEVIKKVKWASLGEALIAGYKHAFEMRNLEEIHANLAKLPEEIQVPEWRPQTKKTNSEKIKGKKAKTLDVGLLGELERGLKRIIKLSDEVILCIDKFNTLIGAREGEGEGDTDVA